MYFNNNWYAQFQPKLDWLSVEERTKEYLVKHWWNNYDQWVDLSKEIWIKTEVAVCIAKSETTLWKHLATNNSLRNCMNNDRGVRVHAPSFETAFKQLWSRCLNGKYLKNKQDLHQLYSNSPLSKCYHDSTYPHCKYVFASSPYSAPVNVVNCLSNIYDKQMSLDFKFRLAI